MRWLGASKAMLLAIVLGVAVGAVFPGVDSIGEQLRSQTAEAEQDAALGVIAAPPTETPKPKKTEKPAPDDAPPRPAAPPRREADPQQTQPPTSTQDPGTVVVVTNQTPQPRDGGVDEGDEHSSNDTDTDSDSNDDPHQDPESDPHSEGDCHKC